jgi:uncharacterized protein
LTKKTVIADASPLIAFARIQKISLITDTVGSIIIPETVADECLIDISRPGARQIQEAIHKKIIHVHKNADIRQFNDLSDILDKGEAFAIALALQLKTGLLIDEKLGRNVARKLNLKIIGTAGVLLLAKQRGLIKKIFPVIDQLKQCGYYLSDNLIKEILKRGNEKIS